VSVLIANAFGATKILPPTISWRSVPLEISVPLAELADRPGAVRTGRSRLRPRTIRLEGPIYYPDPAAIRAEVDSILELLSHPPLQVYQHDADERFLFAWPTGAPQEWIDARREVQLTVNMLAPDPYFYGPENQDVEVITASNHAWTIDVDGTAPTHPLVTLVVRGGFSDPRITLASTGRSIRLVGAFAPGDVIEIDTARYIVRRNGVEEMSLAHEDWLIGGFALMPGANPLSWSCTGTPDVDVRITYRSRWY